MDQRGNNHVDVIDMSGANTTAPGIESTTDTLARIGRLLGAVHVELWRRVDGDALTLRAAWSDRSVVSERAHAELTARPIESEAWFPWDLGNVRIEEYLLVHNAADLPLTSDRTTTIGAVGLAACAHFPLRDGTTAVADVCAYWPHELTGWDDSVVSGVADLARPLLRR